jgi:hypothetical protein
LTALRIALKDLSVSDRADLVVPNKRGYVEESEFWFRCCPPSMIIAFPAGDATEEFCEV